MFFEPLPAGDETFPAHLPESPPWSGPSALEAGAVLAVERIVARSKNVVISLPTIRAFGQGCMLDVDVISRQGELSEFAAEWPAGGVDLTIVELDGAAVVAAASRSRNYWPATDDGTER